MLPATFLPTGPPDSLISCQLARFLPTGPPVHANWPPSFQHTPPDQLGPSAYGAVAHNQDICIFGRLETCSTALHYVVLSRNWGPKNYFQDYVI